MTCDRVRQYSNVLNERFHHSTMMRSIGRKAKRWFGTGCGVLGVCLELHYDSHRLPSLQPSPGRRLPKRALFAHVGFVLRALRLLPVLNEQAKGQLGHLCYNLGGLLLPAIL